MARKQLPKFHVHHLNRLVLGLSAALLLASTGFYSQLTQYLLAATAPPASIAKDCSVDVTATLQAWLDSIPNNTTLIFAAGDCYRIDKTIKITSRSNLIFEANGATFKAVTDGRELGRGMRTRSQFDVSKSSNITFNNITIKGAHPNGGTTEPAYVAELEAQHGINITSSTNIIVKNSRITDVYGDFLYLGNQGGAFSQNILFKNNTLSRNGRQGIGITGAKDVWIENNNISEVRRATIDIEPNTASGGADNVVIRNNQIGTGRLLFFASGGSCGPISNIFILDNVFTNKPMVVYVKPPGDCRRGPFTVTGNVVDKGYGSPSGNVLYFKQVDGVTVTHNKTLVQAGRNMHLVRLDGSTDARVNDNEVLNASGVVLADTNARYCAERNKIGNPLTPAPNISCTTVATNQAPPEQTVVEPVPDITTDEGNNQVTASQTTVKTVASSGTSAKKPGTSTTSSPKGTPASPSPQTTTEPSSPSIIPTFDDKAALLAFLKAQKLRPYLIWALGTLITASVAYEIFHIIRRRAQFVGYHTMVPHAVAGPAHASVANPGTLIEPNKKTEL